MTSLDELGKLRLENEKLKKENEYLKNSITTTPSASSSLALDEYLRYGRQLIVPEIGLSGQVKIKNSKILVVGAGGLGSPALAYLAGAGVGTLGIVDDDIVESSNLQRQIIHNTSRIGISKCESAEKFIQELNPNSIKTILYKTRLTSFNAFDIIKDYDLILDCTDGPATRYLINDVAVLLKVPLVSASALKSEGQLLILNFKSGPCYRCLFPIPPPPDSVLSCGDGGIIGPVVGIMGVMQSIEALKIITGAYDNGFTPSMTLFSAFSSPQWRYIRMRGSKKTCAACGDAPSINRKLIESGQYSYDDFCGRSSMILLSAKDRVTAEVSKSNQRLRLLFLLTI